MTKRKSKDLIRAVEKGDVDEVSSLIATFGLSYCKAWSGGCTLLCEALERKHTKIVKILLEHGSQVNSSLKRKTNSPLHIAVKNKDAEMIAMLLDKEANVDAKNHLGETPLHLSIEKNNSKIISLLLNKNADVNAKNKHYQTPLDLAINEDNVEIVELFWRNKADTHARSSTEMNVLHIVAKCGTTKIMEHLLNSGAFIDIECEQNGYTPLHCAVEKYREEMIKLLLERGADINARTKEKSTAFHLAAKTNNDKIVKILLEHKGLDIEAEDEKGKTALNVAIGRGYLPTIRIILATCPQLNNQKNRHFIRDYMCGPHYSVVGPTIVKIFYSHGFGVHPEDANNRKLLHIAIEGGCTQIVEDLLRYGADVESPHIEKKGYTLLHNAATNHRQLNIAEMLIKHGADVNAIDETGNTPITYAINRLNANMTKLLLSSGAEIKFNPDVLHLGISSEAKEIIKMMLDHDVNYDIMAKGTHRKTALWYVVNSKNERQIKYRPIELDLAELLLSRGANVNAKHKSQESLLCTAVKRGCDRMVAILLKYKADVNFSTKIDMKTPLHYSVTRNASANEQIARMLLKAGAAINVEDEMGKTALHYACRNGAKKIFDTLLEFGAKFDHKDSQDSTPLHDAAFNGSLKIVDALLNKSFADVDCTDKNGKTALHVASQHGWPEVVKELLDFGADTNVLCKKGYAPIDYTNPELFQYDEDLHYDSDEPYYDDSNGSTFLSDRCAGKTADMLKRHIIKIESMNIHGSKRNLESVELEDEIKDFQANCKHEVGLMKSERIGKTYVSCYDLLMISTSHMAMLARNEDIVKGFKSSKYQKIFPNYYKMLYYKYKNSQKRQNLLNPNLRFFHFLPGFSVPEIVLWKTR